MIKATVFKNSTDSGNAVYTGIVMEGHAGYAGEGEDIICAAVSALALNSLILGLQNIERDYGKSYINVKFKEV